MRSTIEYPKPAAAYLRCSTDRQDQSIPDQLAELERYAAEQAYEIVEKYVDDGVSGTSTRGRKAFLQMIEDAERAECPFRHVLVYDIKRFSRGDSDEAGHFRYLLKQRGIDVVYVSESFAGDDTDEIVRPVKQYFARKESKDLSKVTIRGQVSSAEAGWWNGGKPPYGYDLECVDSSGRTTLRIRYLQRGKREVFDADGRLLRTLAPKEQYLKFEKDKVRFVPSEPERVEVVRRIYDMYVHQGLGYKNIVEVLNGEGVLAPGTGNVRRNGEARWARTTIKSILEHPAYVGDSVYNRRTGGKFHRISGRRHVERRGIVPESLQWNDKVDWIIVPNTHPAIIDRETNAAAQRILAQRRRCNHGSSYVGGKAKTSPYLLSGLIKCRCGHTFSGQTVNKGKSRKDGTRVKTRYYICGGYLAKGKAVCAKVPLPKEPIETEVRRLIRERVKTFLTQGGREALLEALIKGMERKTGDSAEQARGIKRRLEESENDIDRLLDSLTPTNKEFVDKKLLRIKQERQALEAQLEQLASRPKSDVTVDSLAEEVIECIQQFDEVFEEGTIQEQKEFVSLFVEKVEVDPKERRARVHIRQFPAPSSLDTGKVSIDVVAGARCEHQKTPFPPVDVVEVAFVRKGSTLVPVAA
ncbi:MAG: recombinase family protein [Candidatus Krumholzibacteria bacterium]